MPRANQTFRALVSTGVAYLSWFHLLTPNIMTGSPDQCVPSACGCAGGHPQLLRMDALEHILQSNVVRIWRFWRSAFSMVGLIVLHYYFGYDLRFNFNVR